MDGVRPPVRPSRHERRREVGSSTKSRCKRSIRASWSDPLLSCDSAQTTEKCRFAGLFKPSDGLEPSTPSLPWRIWRGASTTLRGVPHGAFPAIRTIASPRGSCPWAAPSRSGRARTCPRYLSPSDDRSGPRASGRVITGGDTVVTARLQQPKHWSGALPGEHGLVERHRERSEETAALKGDAGSAAERVAGHRHVPEGELDW